MKIIKINSKEPATDERVMVDMIPDRQKKNITCHLSLEMYKTGRLPFADVIDGLCTGYTHSENDDEPHDECKRCAWFKKE